MGQRQPLSTPKAAKFAATSRCGCPLSKPVPRRLRGSPMPHWRHIPPALFVSGKGLWSQYESSNAADKRAGAAREGAPTRSGVLWTLVLGLGVGRGAAAAERCRGQGAWIRADGAIQIVCDQPLSRSISATNPLC